MLHPLDKVSLGYFVPDRTIPSLNSDWIERSDTRLPRVLALRSGGVLCLGWACIRRRGANPINLVRGVGEAGQTPHWSIRCQRPTEATIAADGASSMLDVVQVGTHRSGAQYPRDTLFKGRNIQEFSVRDTSVGDTSTLHGSFRAGGLQRDVVNLYWPIAPSFTSPSAGGMGGGVARSQPMSTAGHVTWHKAQINFRDLPPYLTYGSGTLRSCMDLAGLVM